MTPVYMLVYGGRDFVDYAGLAVALDGLWPGPYGCTHVLTGGAMGADRLAINWAQLRGIPTKVIYAEWRQHGRFAGPLRNQALLKCGPVFAVEFPGGRGTADMRRRLDRAYVPVFEARRAQ